MGSNVGVSDTSGKLIKMRYFQEYPASFANHNTKSTDSKYEITANDVA